jgi:hypothetical protein
LSKGTIWLFGENSTIKVPSMLCSTVNKESSHAATCKVNVISDITSVTSEELQENETVYFDWGVTLHRLNPTNSYHTLFEDMIPTLARMHRNLYPDKDVTGLSIDTMMKTVKWGVFLTDTFPNDLLDSKFWKEFLPEIIIVPPSENHIYHVQNLLAGTGTPCAHWGHCHPDNRPRGIFDPPDAALNLRSLVFHRYGILEREQLVTIRVPRKNHPRVTLVQRSKSRCIYNLQEVVSMIEVQMGSSPKVVDMAQLSIEEQVLLAYNTDIFILVHGGALTHILWLPTCALIIDIYPHGFSIDHHSGIVHWIRKSMEPAYHIGHLPFAVETSVGQSTTQGPLISGCVCHTAGCQFRVFQSSTNITLHAARFVPHLQEGLRIWQEANYSEPLSPKAFDDIQKENQRKRDADERYQYSPSC